MKVVDLSNKIFGRLTVLNEDGNDLQGRKRWKCKCECGKITTVDSRHLLQGKTMSCGCLQKELFGKLNRTHGLTKIYKRLINVWFSMNDRCYNTQCTSFKNYGGKGVEVCEEWRVDFVQFFNWSIKSGYIISAPRGVCTIDRINTYGNYEPNNCRWVDMKTQQNNKR